MQGMYLPVGITTGWGSFSDGYYSSFCQVFLLLLFLMAGSSWLWWRNRKTEAQWWHRVVERYGTTASVLSFHLKEKNVFHEIQHPFTHTGFDSTDI